MSSTLGAPIKARRVSLANFSTSEVCMLGSIQGRQSLSVSICVTRGMDLGMLAAGQLQQECIRMLTLQYLEVMRRSTECINV